MSGQPQRPESRRPIRRALVSVYDKTGLDELAPRPARRRRRDRLDRLDRRPGSPTPASRSPQVEELTGFPECLDGRVKTLHPRVHAGLLADLRLDPTTSRQLAELGIEPFELVVVEPLPVRARRSRSGATPDECVEQIDIGGPSMVRAAAKNHASVAVVVDPARYARRARRGRGGRLHARRSASGWPREAFAHTATYDIAVASWLGSVLADDPRTAAGFPGWVGATWERAAVLRYGENPHQRAALYVATARGPGSRRPSSCTARRCRYNNYVDADAARRAAYDFDRAGRRDHQARQPVRHRGRRRHRRGAPQGARLRPGVRVRRRDRDQPAGHRRDGRAGRRDLHRGRRRAGVRATEALELLSRKKNLRLLRAARRPRPGPVELRPITGGLLVQTADRDRRAPATTRRPGRWPRGAAADDATLADLAFAWRACRAVKSNAILLAARRRDGRRRHGPGQPGRLGAARGRPRGRPGGRLGRRVRRVLPVPRRARGAARRRRARVVQPGGSIRDERGHRGGRRRPASRCTSPARVTSPTEPASRRTSRADRGSSSRLAGSTP